jgi:hypothetical protein
MSGSDCHGTGLGGDLWKKEDVMKKVSLLTLSLLLAGAAVGSPANAGIAINGIAINGVALNGVALNGVALNGVALNGVAVPEARGVLNLGGLILSEILLPAKLEVVLPLHAEERLAPKSAQ